jgi:phytoene synthase
MSARELDAAGIRPPELRQAYLACRRLNARHGKTFFLATRLLPPAKRPYVHALYGFARYADDIVDDLDPALEPRVRALRFRTWRECVVVDLARGESSDPICAALIDTLRRWQIPPHLVGDFLESMEMDLTVRGYETEADLLGYMHGSASVIGLQMLPILGRAHAGVDAATLERCASDLGMAFQLTNFLRDVEEDMRRGRIYLPQQALRRFGVDPAQLVRGPIDDDIRALLAHEIERTRTLYASASEGVELVHPTSRACLRAAIALYGEILDVIERADYDVFSRRLAVRRSRRIRVGVDGLVKSWIVRAAARRPIHTHTDRVANTRQNPNTRSSTGA